MQDTFSLHRINADVSGLACQPTQSEVGPRTRDVNNSKVLQVVPDDGSYGEMHDAKLARDKVCCVHAWR